MRTDLQYLEEAYADLRAQIEEDFPGKNPFIITTTNGDYILAPVYSALLLERMQNSE